MADNHRIHASFQLPDRSYLGVVRRDITRLVESWGFDAADTGRIDIVVAELTSNLLKHTLHGGELLVRALPGDSETPPPLTATAVEIIALDTGPGMRDPVRMLEDGTSTAGSAGQGLGAIRRASEVFDLYSHPDHGTALLVRLTRRRKPLPPPAENWRCGAVVVPKPGEKSCGDGWAMRALPEGGIQLLVTDGLGHGPDAELATLTAITEFEQSTALSPSELLQRLHVRLRGTRGVVAAIAELPPNQQLTYCSVGNIAGRLANMLGAKNLVSGNGIVGHALSGALLTQRYDAAPYPWLILASDGLKTRWDLARYVGLATHDPSLIAAVLYRDHTRGTDDTIVLVAAVRPLS